MRSLRHPVLWLLPGSLWLLWIVFASLSPPPPLAPSFDGLDKALHFSAYLTLAYLYGCALTRAYVPTVVVLAAGVGLSLEVAQGFTELRQFDWWDALANSVGGLAGGLLSLGRAGHVYEQLEAYGRARR